MKFSKEVEGKVRGKLKMFLSIIFTKNPSGKNKNKYNEQIQKRFTKNFKKYKKRHKFIHNGTITIQKRKICTKQNNSQ